MSTRSKLAIPVWSGGAPQRAPLRSDIVPALLVLLPLVGLSVAILLVGRDPAGDYRGILAFLGIVTFLLIAKMLAKGHHASSGFWMIGLVAFLARATIVLFDRSYDFVPPLYSLDANSYDEASWLVASGWRTGTSVQTEFGSVGGATYIYMNAAVYFLIGHSVLTVRMINALLGALSVAYLYLCGRELLGPKRAALVGLMLSFWPSHAFWSGQSLRDSWVFYFLMRASYASVIWLRAFGRRQLAASLINAGLVTLFRGITGLMLIVAIMISGIRFSQRRATRMILAIVLCVVVVAGLHYWDAIVRGGQLAVSELSGLRRNLAIGGSVFFPDLVYHSWLDVLKFAPIGIFYFISAPFPWQVGDIVQYAAAAESLAFYFLILVAIFQIRRILVFSRARPFQVILIFLIVGIAAFGVSEGNVGTAYRHRMQFFPFVLLVLASAWSGANSEHPRRRRERRARTNPRPGHLGVQQYRRY